MKTKDLLYLMVLVGVSILAFLLFQPYLNLIVISLVLVQLFHPLYNRLLKITKNQGFSTFLSVLISIITIVVPILLFSIFILAEVRNLTEGQDIIANIRGLESSINESIRSLNEFIARYNADFQIAQLNLQAVISTFAENAQNQILPVAQQIVALSGNLLFNLFLLVLCLSYFFPIYKRMPILFSKVSPLDKKIDILLFQKFRDTIKGVVKGTFFVALVQATAVLIPLLMLQVPAPILLWLLMIILSVLPIGSGLVWGPVGLALLIEGIRSGNTGQIVIAIALVVYSAIIINVIDTTLRPIIMKDTVNIHPLLTIFSVLGGLTLFGVMGILYGPIIVVMFLSIMEIYNKHYLHDNEVAPTDN